MLDLNCSTVDIPGWDDKVCFVREFKHFIPLCNWVKVGCGHVVYDAGPSPDPWIKLAVMNSKSDSSPASTVRWECPERNEITQL